MCWPRDEIIYNYNSYTCTTKLNLIWHMTLISIKHEVYRSRKPIQLKSKQEDHPDTWSPTKWSIEYQTQDIEVIHLRVDRNPEWEAAGKEATHRLRDSLFVQRYFHHMFYRRNRIDSDRWCVREQRIEKELQRRWDELHCTWVPEDLRKRQLVSPAPVLLGFP